MNKFGRIFSVSIYGESHGKGVGVVLDGVTPGLELKNDDFIIDLERRKPKLLGTTKRMEDDCPQVLSGIINDYTTGAPINIFFENKNINSKDYRSYKEQPRPGHADYTGTVKYQGYNDIRGGGHFSGRLTLGLVAGGVVANKILEKKLSKPLEISSRICKLGKINLTEKEWNEFLERDSNSEELITKKTKIIEEIERVLNLGDSLGGIIECRVKNLNVGYGEPFFDSLESMLAHGLFSIPGVKGVEFGTGFKGIEELGSEFNDEIEDINGKTLTNNSGGVNGGISNGNEIVFSVAIRPTPSISKEQNSFNFETECKEKLEINGRHDVAFILRVPVIIEAVVKIVLADLVSISNYEEVR